MIKTDAPLDPEDKKLYDAHIDIEHPNTLALIDAIAEAVYKKLEHKFKSCNGCSKWEVEEILRTEANSSKAFAEGLGKGLKGNY